MSAEKLAELLLTRHRPGYEINGVWHDHTVCIYSEDVGKVGHDHVCRIGVEWDNCDPESEQHYTLACIECRQTTEDGDPAYPIWPCWTAQQAFAAAPHLAPLAFASPEPQGDKR